MALSLNRVAGAFQGHQVTLWTSMFSGLEIIALDGQEASRKRSLRFKTEHEISGHELGITKATVSVFPVLSLELFRQDETIARFTNPWALPLQLLILLASALLVVGALSLITR